jgi:hypothetical protein
MVRDIRESMHRDQAVCYSLVVEAWAAKAPTGCILIFPLIRNGHSTRTNHYDATGKLTGNSVDKPEEHYEGEIAVKIFCVLVGACILVVIGSPRPPLTKHCLFISDPATKEDLKELREFILKRENSLIWKVIPLQVS